MNWDAWNHLLKSERLPAVLVDLEAFDRNTASIAKIVTTGKMHSPKIRIATKSLRIPSLIKRILSFGAPYHGLMCYSVEEASFLASLGFDDFLIAYPTFQKTDLELLRKVHEDGKLVRLVVDHLDGIRRLDEIFSGCRFKFPIVIEVDMSLRFFSGKLHLGARRSPIQSFEDLFELIHKINDLQNIRLDGLLSYESQVAGVGDSNPASRFLNPFIRLMKRLSVKKIRSLRQELLTRLNEKGVSINLYNGAGTGSLSFASEETCLTELTAGSGFFHPHLFDHYSNLSLEPSCFFALQVVRHPSSNWMTCAGGGYVASGKPGWDKVPLPIYPENTTLSSDEGTGEVQTPLHSTKQLPLGAPAYFRHAKGGELAERFQEYLIISNGNIVERAKTYRGMGQCFF